MHQNRVKLLGPGAPAAASKPVATPTTIAVGFVVCPLAMAPANAFMAQAQNAIYQLAYERARQMAIPRFMLGLNTSN